jgi:thioredoxin reductase
MFRKWPLFQRMLSWTKPYAPADRHDPQYERYDWNSLLPDDDAHRGIQAEHMDGTQYFPSRPEMEAGLTAFAERTGIAVRYGCRWESTGRDGGDFVLGTTDGEYRAKVAVFAVGVAEPWRPNSPGIDKVPHYAEMGDPAAYAGKRVFIVGKKNSAFEIANGLLPWAGQIVLGSPSPAKTSVETRSLVGVRARYAQPFEDHLLRGGVFVVNATIDAIEGGEGNYRVTTSASADGSQLVFQSDAVIAATGFRTPLLDLGGLGVTTFGQSGLPAQSALWESTDVPGIYFAGTISQGAAGLKKHGIPSNSGAVHGHRYNARVLARHIATTHFGTTIPRPSIARDDVVSRLLDELSGLPGHGADIFHQRSYLARCVVLDPGKGLVDAGVQPLTRFLDGSLPDGAAVTLESNSAGDMYPAVYVRVGGKLEEHLMDGDTLLDFRGDAHRRALSSILKPVLGS